MAVSNAQLKEALLSTAGVFAQAGKLVGMTGQGVGKRVAKNKALQELVAGLIGDVSDIAKSHILIAIQKGDLKWCAWWLERRDPDFRPQARIEATGKDGAPLVDMSTLLQGLTNEELTAVQSIRRRNKLGETTGDQPTVRH